MLLVIAGILELIFLSNQLIRYLSDVVSGQMAFTSLFKFLGLQAFYLLDILLPLALFLGILLAFGRLYADSEMTVLSACGISRLRLLMMTMGVAIPAIIVVAMMSLWLNPMIAVMQQKIMASNSAELSKQLLRPGRFQAMDHGRLIFYAEKMSRNFNHLENVFIAEQVIDKSSPTKHWALWSAEQGSWQSKFDAVYFVLDNGYRYSGVPGEKNFQISKYAHFGVRIQQHKTAIVKRHTSMSSWELLKYAKTNNKYSAELQLRISIPLSMLILVLLAVPLSRVQPRAGRFTRFLPAILLYIVYVNLLMVAKTWVVNGTVPVIVGMWWVQLLALLVTVVIWQEPWQLLNLRHPLRAFRHPRDERGIQRK